jgi:hypothetical protein
MKIEEALEKHELTLLAIPGVEKVGIGEDENRLPVILILVKELTADLQGKLPTQLEGFPVKVTVAVEPLASEELRALWRGGKPEELG